jgi:hypothetical protein
MKLSIVSDFGDRGTAENFSSNRHSQARIIVLKTSTTATLMHHNQNFPPTHPLDQGIISLLTPTAYSPPLV